MIQNARDSRLPSMRPRIRAFGSDVLYRLADFEAGADYEDGVDPLTDDGRPQRLDLLLPRTPCAGS